MLNIINPDICKESEETARQFHDAVPFPHIIIDNFLHEAFAEKLLDEFPDVSLMHRSHHYLFTQKYELSFWSRVSKLYAQLNQDFISSEFSAFISEVAGTPVFMDSDFCGELHQGVNGSFIDMHVDFNLHPKRDDWVHDLTLLIYLNKNWSDDYGGQLLLHSIPKVYEISPLFNRCVVMRSDETTFHGYQKLNLPPNVARKSILVNFYRQVAPDQIPLRKPTIWTANYLSPLKSSLAKLYNPISTLKHRLLGLTPAGDRHDLEKIKIRHKK